MSESSFGVAAVAEYLDMRAQKSLRCKVHSADKRIADSWHASSGLVPEAVGPGLVVWSHVKGKHGKLVVLGNCNASADNLRKCRRFCEVQICADGASLAMRA